MNRLRRLMWWSVVAASLAGGQAWAQGSRDSGPGRTLAQQFCSECHAIDARRGVRSPNPAAPPFEAIASVPGMTGAALSSVLQTSHRTMPNIMLNADEMSNIVAYILSIKKAD